MRRARARIVMRIERLLLVLLLAFAGAALGAGAFDALPPEERRVLEPFAERWETLPPATQERLRAGARRWSTLAPGERRAAAARFAEWQQLPPARREAIR